MQNKIDISKYKTLIFDFGGVIIDIDFALTEKMFALLGVEKIDIDFFNDREDGGLFDRFERGEISPTIFRTAMKKKIPKVISDKEFDQAWNALLLKIPQYRIKIIETLKEKYTCVLLSNSNQIHYDYYRGKLEKEYAYKKFSDLFHHTYFSHEIALRKPYSDIYKKVSEDLNLNSSEVLFIDDMQANIEGAKKAVNWNTVLWKNRSLKELLI